MSDSEDADKAAQRLRNRALRLLAQREYSQAELLKKLSQAPRIAHRRAGGNSRASSTDTVQAAQQTGLPPTGLGAVCEGDPAVFEGASAAATDLSPPPMEWVRSSARSRKTPFVPEGKNSPEGEPAHAPVPPAQVLQRLVDDGYQSDERYAASVVRRLGAQSSGRTVREALKSAGVERETVDAAMQERVESDETVCAALWQRKFGRAPENEKEKARQVRFLQSRGFSFSLILKVVKNAGAVAPDE